jgi:hypothetical protein
LLFLLKAALIVGLGIVGGSYLLGTSGALLGAVLGMLVAIPLLWSSVPE